jgi:hypothetical protein
MNEPNPRQEREKLEREADAVRARLLRDVDALTDRGDRVMGFFRSLQRQARKHRVLLIGAGIGAAVFVVVAVSRSSLRARRERRRNWIEQLLSQAAIEESRTHPKPEGFVRKSLRRAGTELATVALSEVGRRGIAHLPRVRAGT